MPRQKDEKEFNELLQLDESTTAQMKVSHSDCDDSRTVVWTEEDENELHLLLETDWSTFTVSNSQASDDLEILQHQSHSF
jgi:hypothetical protein